MNKIATIILNRNLPNPTNKLVENLRKNNNGLVDIFVVEAGSDKDNISKYCTWHADWKEAMEHGLRYSRGMNYGLSQLWKEGKFKDYSAFLLLTNDTEFQDEPICHKLMAVMENHPRVGILSPCSKQWGERMLLAKEQTKYFWFIHNNAFLLRREFIEEMSDMDEPGYMNFLFDGTNFRGYGSESELIAKAYANNWAAAITLDVTVEENETYLMNSADIIKTESFDTNLKLYLEEGSVWMKKKYGFKNRWQMQQYVKSFYDRFFEFYPECIDYKI